MRELMISAHEIKIRSRKKYIRKPKKIIIEENNP